jgi:hypothetical protein
MTIVPLFVVLIVVGVVLYLVNTFIPMAQPVRTIINVIVILFLCLWLLDSFGLLGVGPRVGVNRWGCR